LKEDKSNKTPVESDNQASARKEDHIDLAFKSQVEQIKSDERFYYEPLLSAHPKAGDDIKTLFLDKVMNFPVFVSSMTGGTEKAKLINHNLAKACGEFGLGMGLGSCRQLLYDSKRKADFDVRNLMPDQPLLINLGISQIEELIENRELSRIDDLISLLDADGLIIHVNPLQEWLQSEGDRLTKPAIETIELILAKVSFPIVVKEVGQGFGKESLNRLLRLPLDAIDLAGFGGTNFSKLELLRSDEIKYESYKELFNLGHSCDEMLEMINENFEEDWQSIKCENIIFSGGIQGFLDGSYFMKKCKLPSYYAQASAFLKYAQNYNELQSYIRLQMEGLKLANAFLKIKN